MNNSHGHALKLHLQLHEGVRTFREVASVRHIMRSISVSCSRQRFKAGMVDLRVGRKAGGDRCTWSSNEPFSWTPREQLDDIDMIFRNGPMVTALDLLGLSERVSVRWCIVGRCWKKEVSCTDLTNVIWGLQSDHFHSNQRARFSMDSCEKQAQKIAELLWPPHFCKQTPPWILNLEISSESEVLLE